MWEGICCPTARAMAMTRPTLPSPRSLGELRLPGVALLLHVWVAAVPLLGLAGCAETTIEMAKPEQGAVELARDRLPDASRWREMVVAFCPEWTGRTELRFTGDGDVFALSFGAAAPRSVTVSLEGSPLTDTVVFLYGDTGAGAVPLAADDDGGPGGLSRLVVEAPSLTERTQYWVLVTSWHGRALGVVTSHVTVDGESPCGDEEPADACIRECLAGGLGEEDCRRRCAEEAAEPDGAERECIAECVEDGEDVDLCRRRCAAEAESGGGQGDGR